MIDSLLYWVQEYNIDGFRFDLMGIHDVKTMQMIRQSLDEIDPNIIPMEKVGTWEQVCTL